MDLDAQEGGEGPGREGAQGATGAFAAAVSCCCSTRPLHNNVNASHRMACWIILNAMLPFKMTLFQLKVVELLAISRITAFFGLSTCLLLLAMTGATLLPDLVAVCPDLFHEGMSDGEAADAMYSVTTVVPKDAWGTEA